MLCERLKEAPTREEWEVRRRPPPACWIKNRDGKSERRQEFREEGSRAARVFLCSERPSFTLHCSFSFFLPANNENITQSTKIETSQD